MRAYVEALPRTFPDFRLQIDEIIGEGDRIATRVTGRETHKGEWMGIRPTGAVIRVKGINIDRVADERIVEHWGEADTAGMLRQRASTRLPAAHIREQLSAAGALPRSSAPISARTRR